MQTLLVRILGSGVVKVLQDSAWMIILIVQRHPDHAIGGTFFWSHHEKFVVVDQRIAFLGGIDLCFG